MHFGHLLPLDISMLSWSTLWVKLLFICIGSHRLHQAHLMDLENTPWSSLVSFLPHKNEHLLLGGHGRNTILFVLASRAGIWKI